MEFDEPSEPENDQIASGNYTACAVPARRCNDFSLIKDKEGYLHSRKVVFAELAIGSIVSAVAKCSERKEVDSPDALTSSTSNRFGSQAIQLNLLTIQNLLIVSPGFLDLNTSQSFIRYKLRYGHSSLSSLHRHAWILF